MADGYRRNVFWGVAIILLLATYWAWLFFSTRMVIIYDSVDYLQSGVLVAEKGFAEYVSHGPRREPLYPLLVAVAYIAAKPLSCLPLDVLKFFQLFILGISLVLLRMLLARCKVSNVVSWLLVLYMGISPAFVTSALSIYSEIVVYPLVLLAVLFYCRSLSSLCSRSAISWAILAGLVSVALVLIKAVFELAIPIFLVLCFFVRIGSTWRRIFPLLIAGIVFFAGVNIYKAYNFKLNGNFVVANRGSWALYGSTKRRTDPLTIRARLAGIAFAAGRGACERFFGHDECVYWSFETSDGFATIESSRLVSLGLSSKEIDRAYLTGSLRMAGQAPLQYAFFTLVEGIKMFFWETTQLGFVEYPPVLSALFCEPLFSDGLRGIVSLLSFIGFVVLAFRLLRGRTVEEGARISFFFFVSVVVAYSPFLILTRYGLPTASLLLMMIGLLFSKGPYWKK